MYVIMAKNQSTASKKRVSLTFSPLFGHFVTVLINKGSVQCRPNDAKGHCDIFIVLMVSMVTIYHIVLKSGSCDIEQPHERAVSGMFM